MGHGAASDHYDSTPASLFQLAGEANTAQVKPQMQTLMPNPLPTAHGTGLASFAASCSHRATLTHRRQQPRASLLPHQFAEALVFCCGLSAASKPIERGCTTHPASPGSQEQLWRRCRCCRRRRQQTRGSCSLPAPAHCSRQPGWGQGRRSHAVCLPGEAGCSNGRRNESWVVVRRCDPAQPHCPALG